MMIKGIISSYCVKELWVHFAKCVRIWTKPLIYEVCLQQRYPHVCSVHPGLQIWSWQ